MEATYQNAEQVISEFNKYFTKSNLSKSGNYQAYVIPKKNNTNKVNDLMHLLSINGIQYGYINSKKSKSVKSAFHYASGQIKSIKITDGDLCIPVNQHFGTLVDVLFEPRTFLSDTLTYDITAWSLPYVYGLDAYAIDKKLNVKIIDQSKFPQKEYTLATNNYGYLSKWGSMNELQFLAELLKNKVTVRVVKKHSPIVKLITSQEHCLFRLVGMNIWEKNYIRLLNQPLQNTSLIC